MIDPILKVKDEKDLKHFLQSEKDEEEIYRLQRINSPMAKIMLYHNFGIGDNCPCSNCGN